MSSIINLSILDLFSLHFDCFN